MFAIFGEKLKISDFEANFAIFDAILTKIEL
jgi:hypothetical protein